MRQFLVLVGCLALVCAAAGTVASADEPHSESWVDRIDFGGDLRLRYEGFSWDTRFDDGDRQRFRFRLRAGFEARVRDGLTVGFQLRSGNPDNPHSDNQSLDGGFDKTDIAIAEAYVDWKANEAVSIIAGKFSPKELWNVSDMQWDDDVTTEGAMQTFRLGGGDGFLKRFEANTYQFVLEESSSSGDAYLFGAQARPTFVLDDENELTIGAGFDAYQRPDKVVALTVGGRLATEPGDTVTNLIDPVTGELISDFRVANAFIVWKNRASKDWPLKVSLFYYKNAGAESRVGDILTFDDGMIDSTIATVVGDENDTALYGRVQVGDYKKPGQMAFRYTYYDSEPDALFYAFVQSDTVRGSNVEGHRFDFRLGMPAKGHLNVTWYNTDWKVGTDATMDRWQVDYIFKF